MIWIYEQVDEIWRVYNFNEFLGEWFLFDLTNERDAIDLCVLLNRVKLKEVVEIKE